MRAGLITLLPGAALAAYVLLPPSLYATGTPAPQLQTLQPGAFRNIAHDVDVNVVFVGYQPGDGPREIDLSRFMAGLPATHRPVITAWNRYIGLTYSYRYNVVFADDVFENALFSYLSSIAIPAPRTLVQNLYNHEPGRTLDVALNHAIDAPSVEKWLARNPPPGVDTTRYTIFFMNWYGRPDFRFHVYSKTDEPDPDTGIGHGTNWFRQMIAWGGTAPDDPESGLGTLHRIWFHDLSAGPDGRTTNWDLTFPDVDLDGEVDYRIPPVWEYGNQDPVLYRPFTDLTGDLAKIVRYVAIDTLFTASALFNPAISAPLLPSRIQLDLNVYQGDSRVDAKTFFNAAYLRAKLAPLQPLNAFSTEVNDLAFDGRPREIYECFISLFIGPADSCFGQRRSGNPWNDLFLYHDDHINEFIEGDADHEIPMFFYYTPDDLAQYAIGGFVQGGYVFSFLNPLFSDLGYGMTSTAIHEVGHHLGLNHPWEGYDYEHNRYFFPAGAYWFTWVGDESNTVMNYLNVNDDFSQFDRDNMNRFLVVSYINQANSVLAHIYTSPRAGEAAPTLLMADASAASALTAFAAMDYPNAAAQARRAYGAVIAAAAAIGVKVEPQAFTADYRSMGRSPMFVDTVRYPRVPR